MKKRALVLIVCLAVCSLFLQILPSGVLATDNPTAAGLAEFAIKAYGEGWGYVYGTYGQMINQSIIDSKARQYPDMFNSLMGDGRTVYQVSQKWVGHRAADCVGLIKAYLWWRGDASSPAYTAAQDRSANGLYATATVKGSIDTLPETHGICLWKEGHVGVYIGNGWVIESRGCEYGVVLTRLSDRAWSAWFQNPYVSYSANGWTVIAGQTYYYRGGCFVTGLQSIDGGIYYFSNDGIVQSGFATVDGQLRYFRADGQQLSGWQIIDGNRYYLQSGSVACTGWTTVEGQPRLFGADGILLTGWQTTADGIYYLNSDGVALTGAQTVNGQNMTFSTDGRFRRGWQTSDAGRSFNDGSGQALTGRQMIDGQAYCFNADGLLQTGWQSVGDKTSYYDPASGQGNAGGLQTIEGQAWLFDPAGSLIMTAGLTWIDSSIYLSDSTGRPQTGLQAMTATGSAGSGDLALQFAEDGTLQGTFDGLSLDTASLLMTAGTSPAVSLQVAGLPDGTSAEWFCLDPSIAGVDAAGLVTAAGAGRTLIVARAPSGAYAVCTATILPDPASLTPAAEPLTLEPGRSAYLSVAGLPDELLSAVTLSSSAPSVATVDAAGCLTAVAPGQATISLAYGGWTADFLTVNVSSPFLGLSADRAALTLPVGGRANTFAAAVPAEVGVTITYSSSNPVAASVGTDGRIKALALGTAVITAAAGSQTVSCTVTVSGNYPTLRRGSSNEQVADLQRRLADLGYIVGPADGSFGPLTEYAVNCFQKNLGLTLTGTADHNLQIALQSDTAPRAAGRQAAGILQPGDSGESVMIFQQRLFDLSYLKETPTGVFDALTLQAMQAMQTLNGIAVAGYADSGTISGLFGRKIVAGRPSLVLGDSGYEVLLLQTRLQQLQYYGGPLDGLFSADVEKGVKAFQYQNGLSVDGDAGPITQTALFAASAPVCNPQSLLAVTMTPLGSGAVSDAVAVLESRLVALGYLYSCADTVYDSRTTAAISAFQAQNGLAQTGSADVPTQLRLVGDNAVPSAAVVAYGSRGDAVKQIQSRLNQLGYSCGSADGIFGSRTHSALKRYQTAAGLVADGRAGQATVARLFAVDAPAPAAAPAATTRAASDTLQIGSTGDGVLTLETRLVALGYLYSRADSNYDSLTAAAVKAFQKRSRLRQTGVADVNTQQQLLAANARTASTSVRYGSRGDNVRRVQSRLAELGYSVGRVDGRFGTGTRNAVRAFQRRLGLKADGIVGPATAAMLFSDAAPSAG